MTQPEQNVIKINVIIDGTEMLRVSAVFCMLFFCLRL